MNMAQKTPEEIEAMALEAPSTAPAVSKTELFGADDRDRYYLYIQRVRPSDRRKYCLLTHHDRINEMTLSMRFPHKRNEAAVISFKISFEGANGYQGETISVAFSDLYRQPHPNRAFDRWVFKVDRHDVSFERYSMGRIYTILLPVTELWKFAGDWRISSNMTLQGEAHEDLGNMVLADSECGYKTLVDNWPQNR